MASSCNSVPGPVSKTSKFDYSKDLMVLVGADKEKFIVHKDIICKSSDFFSLACTGEWLEARDKTVRLPEREPIAFGVYVGWLYTGVIDLRSESGGQSDTRNPKYGKDMLNGEYEESLDLLVEIHSLGNMLQDVSSRNKVVDEMSNMVESSLKVPAPALICDAWDTMPQTSKLIRLWVDYIVVTDPDLVVKTRDLYPAEFVKQIAEVCLKERAMTVKDRLPSNRPKCFYHEHKDETDKCP